MRRWLPLGVVGAALVGALGFALGVRVFDDDDATAPEPALPALDEWLLQQDVDDLYTVVEDSRTRYGWAAGCLWRDTGQIEGMFAAPSPAIIEHGIMPTGRPFSIMRSAGEAGANYATVQDDAFYCLVPESPAGPAPGDV